MTPATPVIVKSGRNATPMMSVENVIGPATSRDACRIRSGIVPFPCGPRCRKMFSIMMTVESTTMPKSTAPSEMRFAGVSVPDHAAERDEQRERDVERRDDGGARVPEEEEEHDRHEQHPDDEVLEHRVRRQLHQVAAVVVGHDVHPRRQDVVRADVVDALVDALQRRLRLAAVAHEDDALDDVRLVVVADDAEARRVADVDVGDVPDARRARPSAR